MKKILCEFWLFWKIISRKKKSPFLKFSWLIEIWNWFERYQMFFFRRHIFYASDMLIKMCWRIASSRLTFRKHEKISMQHDTSSFRLRLLKRSIMSESNFGAIMKWNISNLLIIWKTFGSDFFLTKSSNVISIEFVIFFSRLRLDQKMHIKSWNNS